VVCYDIKDLGKQLKKLGMLIVQDQVWNRVTVNRYQKKTTRYFIDEFHLLLREEQTAAYSVEIWKRFRKWGGIPTGITQNIKDLLRSQEIENIFENSEYICMLNQAAEDRRILAEHLGINSQQLQFVTKVGEGQGLIFYGSVIVPFVDHFPKNTRMYRIMTTKLSETSGESGSAPVKKLPGAKPKPSGQSGSGSIATMDQPASGTDAFENGSYRAAQEGDSSEQIIKEVQEENSVERMAEEVREEDPFEQMIREVREEGSLQQEIKEVQEENPFEQPINEVQDALPGEEKEKESVTDKNASLPSEPDSAARDTVSADKKDDPGKDTTGKAVTKRGRGRPSKKELEARRAEESAAVAETEKSDGMPAEEGAVRAEKEMTEPEAEDHESEGKEITPASAPIKKKRGRPSKKEIAERKAAEESQAAGQ
jgi:hypothetical protein